jgi:long-chain acyl-CoA synthetase
LKIRLISRQFPDRVACIAEEGKHLTYDELLRAVSDFRADLPTKSLLFIVGSNDLETITCYLAALECGAVPLLLGEGIKDEQLNSLIEAYDPNFIFHPTNWFDKGDRWTLARQHGSYGLWQRTQKAYHKMHENLALLLATSGSTGSPKLVRLSLKNLVSNAESIAQYLKIDPQQRAITTLPFNYSYGLSVLNSHFYAGASLVLTNRSMFDPHFWRLVTNHQVTSFAGVPYSIEMLLKLRFERMNIPSVRTITLAGGRLDSEKMRKIFEICAQKGIDFYPMYGQTEASPRMAYLPTEQVLRKPASIGVAIPGGRLWVEGENGEIASEPGAVGELVYEGTNVSLGYAESISDLSLGDSNKGVLRTGDLGHVDQDGFFYVDGRKRRFLKIFGVRISLDAVEKIVSSKGLSNAANGIDDKLVLFIEQPPAELHAEDLRNMLAETLGVNKAGVEIRTLSELPRMESGKVNYLCLK